MILLDTCAIIWDATQANNLSITAQQTIEQAELTNNLWICDISYWEIAMLISKKRLDFGISSTEFFILYHQKRHLNIHSINANIAQLSVSFNKSVNNDPADRLILATALTYHATLITADENLKAFPQVKTLN